MEGVPSLRPPVDRMILSSLETTLRNFLLTNCRTTGAEGMQCLVGTLKLESDVQSSFVWIGLCWCWSVTRLCATCIGFGAAEGKKTLYLTGIYHLCLIPPVLESKYTHLGLYNKRRGAHMHHEVFPFPRPTTKENVVS